MPCYSIDGVVPVVHSSSYVHPSAVLIGDVVIGPNCYIGPLASLRGDFGLIRIDEGSNVQDSCVLHCLPNRVLHVGAGGHIGHAAILHGCKLEIGVLIGMNSTVMDDVVIGERSIVAANAFVKSKSVFGQHQLIVGSPAKTMRELRSDEIDWKHAATHEYQDLAKRSIATCQMVEPVRELRQPITRRIQVDTELTAKR